MPKQYTVWSAAPGAVVIGWWVQWSPSEQFRGGDVFPSLVEAVEYITTEAAENDRPDIYPLSVSPLARDCDIQELRRTVQEHDRLKKWAEKLAARQETREVK